MNVMFTCGGTGGHINPAIAVANIWKERHPEGKILFIGATGHMEEELVPKAGYELVTFPAAAFARGKSWASIKYNLRAVKRITKGVQSCKKIIREFAPDVIIGTGGYASFPAIMAGTQMGVPTCVHESNAMPGLTTRLVADRVDRVLVCFPESAKHYRHPEKVQAVGMPVRREFVYTRKSDARKALGLGDGPVVVSAFGSQGARAMNEAVLELFRLEQRDGFPFHHIHAAGSYGWEWMPQQVKELGIDLDNCPAIDMREYVYDMPTVMAAADVVISRAGASTCNEIAASGTPCILIPSPNVTDNHQEKNARVMEQRGGAEVLLERDCTGQRLYQQVTDLLNDPARRREMSASLMHMAVPDSAEQICNILEQLAASRA